MSLVEQSVRLGAAWSPLCCTIHGRGPRARLVCRGRLRPASVTRVYEVALEYEIGRAPVALVEQPTLVGRPDQGEIPHTYAEDARGPVRPCLYYPPDGDWREDRALAWTIIPWLLEWLIEYEVWLVTGVWCGGGVAHRRAPSVAIPLPTGDESGVTSTTPAGAADPDAACHPAPASACEVVYD